VLTQKKKTLKGKEKQKMIYKCHITSKVTVNVYTGYCLLIHFLKYSSPCPWVCQQVNK